MLNEYDAEILTRNIEVSEYFEKSVKLGKEKGILPKQIANLIINKRIDVDKISPEETIEKILSTKKAVQISDVDLNKIIDKVLEQNQKAVSDFKKGSEGAIMFLVGQVLREAQGASADKVKASLLAKLKNDRNS